MVNFSSSKVLISSSENSLSVMSIQHKHPKNPLLGVESGIPKKR
jgi:hypothetical protein